MVFFVIFFAIFIISREISRDCHPSFSDITFKWEAKPQLQGQIGYLVNFRMVPIFKAPPPHLHSTTDIWSYCLYGQFLQAKTADHISGMECTYFHCQKIFLANQYLYLHLGYSVVYGIGSWRRKSVLEKSSQKMFLFFSHEVMKVPNCFICQKNSRCQVIKW